MIGYKNHLEGYAFLDLVVVADFWLSPQWKTNDRKTQLIPQSTYGTRSSLSPVSSTHFRSPLSVSGILQEKEP